MVRARADVAAPVEEGWPLAAEMLVIRYAGFAAIAIIINLVTQWACLRLYAGPFMLWAALLAGTVTGLMAKFLLDKQWIFYDRAPRSVVAHGRQFGLYTGMGVLTTAILWGTEYLFHYLGDTDAWRLGGGALGLTIGYVLKYQLDKRFVFGTGGL